MAVEDTSTESTLKTLRKTCTDNGIAFSFYDSVKALQAKVGVAPPSLADTAAPKNAVYYSTTQSKLVYKDSGGVVRLLH